MYYDYRSEFNTIISLLQQLLTAFNTFATTFDGLVTFLQDAFLQLMAFLPDVLFFILLFIGIDLVLRLFFPRWRDV